MGSATGTRDEDADAALLGARHETVREVRGLGLMLGIELATVDAAKAVHKQLLNQGIIINRTHDTVLRLRRPDESAPRPYDDEFVPAVVAEKTQPGVEWRAFTQPLPWLANRRY